MIGVWVSRRLYKPLAIPSSSSLPIQGPPLSKHSPNCLPLRFILPTSLMDAAKLRKEQLMALPSVSQALSQLPQARSVDQVSLHPSSMSAQHAAESEAKLRKVLSKSGTPHNPSVIVTPPPNLPSSPTPQLMMKFKSK
ncbi:hypothetical protein BJ322DRAFT_1049124 [Thelephora terrestris]|uniref:Uncharacterized protein n=1 Tax=Thelephora terrestris TaxID=56493 RepID=A0A9P6HK19_9AGAM|nr:hypothetical protein BJ322DRAFT_1049124 [Thelephora terrestris]